MSFSGHEIDIKKPRSIDLSRAISVYFSKKDGSCRAQERAAATGMEFQDKTLKCMDCHEDFVFTAGEQLFFRDKQFHNLPKRCKTCKLKRGGSKVKAETRTHCSVCEQETTVPFRPTQGRPVLCRSCFDQNRRTNSTPSNAEITEAPSALSSSDQE